MRSRIKALFPEPVLISGADSGCTRPSYLFDRQKRQVVGTWDPHHLDGNDSGLRKIVHNLLILASYRSLAPRLDQLSVSALGKGVVI
jgi:hypothetical protein